MPPTEEAQSPVNLDPVCWAPYINMGINEAKRAYERSAQNDNLQAATTAEGTQLPHAVVPHIRVVTSDVADVK